MTGPSRHSGDAPLSGDFPEATGESPGASPTGAVLEEDSSHTRRRIPPSALLFAAVLGVGALVIAAALYLRGSNAIENWMRARIAAIETRLEQVDALKPRLGDLEKRLAALERELGEQKARLGRLDELERAREDLAAAVARVAERLDGLEERIPEPFDPAPLEAAIERRLHALESEIAALRRTPAAAPAAAPQLGTRIAELEARLGRLETRLAAARGGAAEAAGKTPEVGEERMRGLEAKLDALAADLETLRQTAAKESAVLALDARIRALEAAAGPGPQAPSAGLQQELRALGERIAALEKMRAPQVAGDHALIAISAAALELARAIDSGRPFARMLEMLQLVAAGDPALREAASALAPHAESGIPTMAELRALFLRQKAAMRQEAREEGGGDLLAAVRRNVLGLVRIRRQGRELAAAEDPVAAAQAALERNDLEGAVAALAPLADAGSRTARAWISQARARILAAAALARLEDLLRERLAQAAGNAS